MPPDPAPVLRPLPTHGYPAWLEGARQRYATFLVDTGRASVDAAADASRRTHAGLLPLGLQTPGHQIFEVLDGERAVGSVWMHVSADGHAHVYDLHVAPGHRRQGHARRAMAAAMAHAQGHGAIRFGLNVLAANVAARRLYEQLGLETVTLQMSRRLEAGGR